MKEYTNSYLLILAHVLAIVLAMVLTIWIIRSAEKHEHLEEQCYNTESTKEVDSIINNVMENSKMDDKTFVEVAKKIICKYSADVFSKTITVDDIRITTFESKYYGIFHKLVAYVDDKHYEIEHNELEEEFHLRIFTKVVDIPIPEHVLLKNIESAEKQRLQ